MDRHDQQAESLVSVIMNCHNSAEFLKEALDSIYAQTYSNWEIIFWDNASTDESAEIALRYDGKLRYFRRDEKTSLGHARNQALDQARGDFIAFLDCDDLWYPEKVAKQVAAISDHPDACLVYSNSHVLDMTRNLRYLAFRRPQPSGDVYSAFLLAAPNYPVYLHTVMLRRSALEQGDLRFDERLSFSEEFDLFMRLLRHNRAEYVDESLGVRRVHGSMSTIVMDVDVRMDEVKLVMGKLRSLDPDSAMKYGEAFEGLAHRIAYSQAREAVARDLLKARRHIAAYRWRKPKYFVVYLATWLPQPVWRVLFRALKAGRTALRQCWNTGG